MFNIFKKDKIIESRMPKIKDILMLDKFELQSFNDDLLFNLSSEGIKIVDVGKYEIEGLKYTNLYFEDIVNPEIKGYINLNIGVSENIDGCKIFLNYDNIFPLNEEEWDIWIGEDGILSDNLFYIENDDNEKEYDLFLNISMIRYNETVDNGLLENTVTMFCREVEGNFDKEFVSIVLSEDVDTSIIAINIGVDIDPSIIGLS